MPIDNKDITNVENHELETDKEQIAVDDSAKPTIEDNIKNEATSEDPQPDQDVSENPSENPS